MPGACGTPRRPSPDPCDIRADVKNRNGKPRWWCHTHGCEAWRAGGEPLDECAGARVAPAALTARLVLDFRAYPGGVGIWGALAPVFDTAPHREATGVHVHARDSVGGAKVIDATYDEVVVVTGGRQHAIDAMAARAFVVASVFGLPIEALACPRCGDVHLDLDEFAARPHRKHQCNACGRSFLDPRGQTSISNPLAALVAGTPRLRTTEPARDRVEFSCERYGRIAVWASNPAILWTAPLVEAEGLHVHAWDHSGARVIDDTFGDVSIDGVRLDIPQVRALMVQQSLSYLSHRVQSLRCAECGEQHFDSGPDALVPVRRHTCERCGAALNASGRVRKVVSNPAVALLQSIKDQRGDGSRHLVAQGEEGLPWTRAPAAS